MTDNDTTDARILWAASVKRGTVVLMDDISAGEYTPDEARAFGARFTEAARKATDGHAIARWLSDAGCPPEVIGTALEAWRDKSARQELVSAMNLFTKGGLF